MDCENEWKYDQVTWNNVCTISRGDTLNPIQGGSEHILFRGDAILHTPANFWATERAEILDGNRHP